MYTARILFGPHRKGAASKSIGDWSKTLHPLIMPPSFTKIKFPFISLIAAAGAAITPIEADAIRLSLWQQRSVPVLATIKNWFDAEQKLVLPRSPMAQAMT